MAQLNAQQSPGEIVVTINSQERSLPAEMNLIQLIELLKLEPRYLAIELNGQVISRKLHATTRLTEGDVLEVVTLVGGG
ncbi:sulfur carrier protein ThiS [Planctopirus hydrillae]|uniref:Thiamine biosynthesis protein ThiS n=1 Tax=Planctopirus hydrillae TaxID=1841610 RepID=A0A1C3ENN8_9PLAN|nr:sulfur carrier protein ThiS [Planctopirus hydrillae]ODA34850.1 thiamine biosynthesis protein ThiS [Planctopirus hydrillae]